MKIEVSLKNGHFLVGELKHEYLDKIVEELTSSEWLVTPDFIVRVEDIAAIYPDPSNDEKKAVGYVPTEGYCAVLHTGEVIVPRHVAEEWAKHKDKMRISVDSLNVNVEKLVEIKMKEIAEELKKILGEMK